MLRSTFVLFISASFVNAQSVLMEENFKTGTRTVVEQKLDLTGTIQVAGKNPKRIEIVGGSQLKYDERILARDQSSADKVLRNYREVEFKRTVNGEAQSQEIRKAVRRMVILRSPDGKKAPFSPDGPITFDEISAIKSDLFMPVLVSGILPSKLVQQGDEWAVSKDATLDLTGLESVDKGQLTVKYLSPVTIAGQKQYRLSITGNVTGISEDGPCQHRVDSTAYFDPAKKMLTYLNIKGIQDLFDEKGQISGTLTGRLTIQRNVSDELTDRDIEKLTLSPNSENSLLLYQNADLGIQFVYPRHWRVGAVQGRQVTLESAKFSAGMLITVETTKSLPTGQSYRDEARSFIQNQKGRVDQIDELKKKDGMERFGIDAELNNEKIRMEYAIQKMEQGGVTVAARMPVSSSKELVKEIEMIFREIKALK